MFVLLEGHGEQDVIFLMDKRSKINIGKNFSYSYFETALARVKKYWVPRLANLFAMYTGMRASEVQALRVCDIFDKYIWVSHA